MVRRSSQVVRPSAGVVPALMYPFRRACGKRRRPWRERHNAGRSGGTLKYFWKLLDCNGRDCAVAGRTDRAAPEHGVVSLPGPNQVCGLLKAVNYRLSRCRVRGVWGWHGLLLRPLRLLRLKRSAREQSLDLSDKQVRRLDRISPEFRERRIKTRHRGNLVAVDTSFVGVLKSVGRVYLHSVPERHSRDSRGRLCTGKLPVTVVHVLNQDVLPHFEAADVSISSILADNGREFCPGRTGIPTGCSCSWSASTAARPGSAGRRATALWSACAGRCWTSTSASRAGRSGVNLWRKGQRIWSDTTDLQK